MVLFQGIFSCSCVEYIDSCCCGFSNYPFSVKMYYGLTTQFNTISWIIISVPLIALFVCTLLCGWLADARFGKYRVFKTGSIVLFSVEVMLCLRSLVFSSTFVPPVVIVVITPIMLCLCLISMASCIVISLQLGLDQMPDASAANITSFISWFVCCLFTGFWVGDASYHLLSNFLDPLSSFYNSFFPSLFPVLCMAIVLTKITDNGAKVTTVSEINFSSAQVRC